MRRLSALQQNKTNNMMSNNDDSELDVAYSTARNNNIELSSAPSSMLDPLPQESVERLSQLEKYRSSQLENFVRKLSFQEMAMTSRRSSFHRHNSTVRPLGSLHEADADEGKTRSTTLTFKSVAGTVRQSLISLMTSRQSNGSVVSTGGLPHLCSGTINGRGSFMNTPATQRQRRYCDRDSLERVLQNSTRIRQLYGFMQSEHCPELLEFWSIVELYQNLYWKPFKLLGINFDIEVKKKKCRTSETTETTETTETSEILPQTKNKNNSGEVKQTTLACVLSNFTLTQEETLRNEIVAYYIANNAPMQICLPSQNRLALLEKAKMAMELPDDDRLGLFREAQRFCYNEMQQIHMQKFLQYEDSSSEQNEPIERGDTPPHSPGLAAITSSLLATDVLRQNRYDSVNNINNNNNDDRESRWW
jgi:hypothetical protein